jgi:hypothetical protein
VFDLICCRCRSCWWQYSTGIIYTGGKFAAGIIDTSGNNLPPVSITPEELVAKFAAGVVGIPVVHLHLRISPQIFEKIRNDPSVNVRRLGKDDS